MAQDLPPGPGMFQPNIPPDVNQFLKILAKGKGATQTEVESAKLFVESLAKTNPKAWPLGPNGKPLVSPFSGSLAGDREEQMQRAYYWLNQTLRQNNPGDPAAATVNLPTGKAYGTAAETATQAAVKSGGNPIARSSSARAAAQAATDPVQAAAVEAATAAGRTPIPNLTTPEQNAALIKQLAQDQLASQFAAESAATGTFVPRLTSPGPRVTIPRPTPQIPTIPESPITPQIPTYNIGGAALSTDELVNALTAQATGAVNAAARTSPGLTANQVAANYLDEVLGKPGTGVLSAAEEAPLLTAQSIDDATKALTAQAAKAGASTSLLDEALAAAAPASLMNRTLGLTGGLIAGIGLPIAGGIASNILQGSTANTQGEVPSWARVGGGALQGAGVGAGLGATIGAPLFGIGAIPGGLIGAAAGGLIGGLGEAAFGHDAKSFETQVQEARQKIIDAFPQSLDPTTRNNLLNYFNVQFQLAQTPSQLNSIVSTAPNQILGAMASSQQQQQQQAKLLAAQSVLSPILSRLYDTSTHESQLAFDRGNRAADALTSIDPGLAALSRERASTNYSNALNETAANASMLASYPAAQQLDLMNNLNSQVQASLVGRLAQQVANSYLPASTVANTGLTG